MRSFIILLLLGIAATPSVRADYVFSSYGSIERFDDEGRYLGPYTKTGFNVIGFDPETESIQLDTTEFIDESIDGLTLASDGRVYALGNSLGQMSLHGFDPISGFSPRSRVVGGQFPGLYEFDHEIPLGRSGSLVAGLSGDDSGNLWSIGHIVEAGVGGPTDFDAGFALVRVPVESNEPPEVVLQLGPPGYVAPGSSIPFGPLTLTGTATIFLSTPAGLVEIDLANDFFKLGWENALFQSIGRQLDPVDTTHPYSPYRPEQPWMHPLLSGDLAGNWEYGTDGLLRSVRGFNEGQTVTIETYDPRLRELRDSVDVSLHPAEELRGAFFRPDGVLMLLTESSVNRQRLIEVDLSTGSLLGVVFDIDAAAVLDQGFSLSRLLVGGLYVPPVPEPNTAALIVACLAISAVRRANHAVR